MTDQDEIAYLLELRDTTKRHLRSLTIQRAAFGLDAPAHLDTEIRQATKDIALLEAKLQTISPSQEVVDAIGPHDASTLLLDFRVKAGFERFEEAIARLVTTVGGIGDKLADLADAFAAEQGIRIQRQQEHDERMTAMERGIDANQEQVASIQRRIGIVMWVGVMLAITIGIIVGALVW